MSKIQNASDGRLDSTYIRRFIFAGAAVFSLRSVETGRHFTYRVQRAKGGECRACAGSGNFVRRGRICGRCYRCDGTGEQDPSKQPFFVSVLTGPDNTSSYTYMGMVSSEQAETARPVLDFTRASRFDEGAPSVLGFRWLLRHLEALPTSAELYHMGRCGRCKRPLTVPSSIASGLGPVCAQAA